MLRWLASCALAAVVLTGLMLGLLRWQYGSVGAAEARWNGHVLFVEGTARTAEPVRPGDTASLPVPVRNLTAQPVTIVGAPGDCGCVATTDLPLEIPAGQERTLTFRVATSPGQRGRVVSQHAELFSDPSGRPIVLRFDVPVLGEPPPAGSEM